MLNKDAILSADDLEVVTVEVPEWGGEVTLRSMTGKARERFENLAAAQAVQSDESNIRAELAALCLVDDQGALMFADAADVQALGEKSWQALDRVFNAAKKLNGLGDIEDAEKN